MTTDFHDHPLAAVFPLLGQEELQALARDIADHGLLEPIVLHEGKILDGRNRFRACKIAGVEPRFETFTGASPTAFVISKNLERRHLNESQRAIIAAELATARQGERTDLRTIDRRLTRAGAAKLFRVSEKSVQRAANLIKSDPDKAAGIKNGQIKERVSSLDRVHKESIRQKQKQDKLNALKAKPASANSDNWRVLTGDCVKVLNTLEDGGYRLVFADPPYNFGLDYGQGKKADRRPDYVEWAGLWIEKCYAKLAADGSLWVMVPDEWAIEIGAILKTKLHLRAWLKWYETFGNNRAGNFNKTSRHIFYCVKDPKRFVFNEEAVSRPSDRQTKYADKRANPEGKTWDDVWQIPRLTGTCAERIPTFPTQLPLAILRPIVGCASDPGDLVLDPFCGSGTTGVACIEAGRKFVGIEQNADFSKLARQRLRGQSC
jgi:site-specific DNA-methyltransferase (adenine-specific)